MLRTYVALAVVAFAGAGCRVAPLLSAGSGVVSPTARTQSTPQLPTKRNEDVHEAGMSASEAAADADLRRNEKPFVWISNEPGFNYTASPDGEWITFNYDVQLCNASSVQVKEVDLALVVTESGTGKEIYRTPALAEKEFDSTRVPSIGHLEAYSSTGHAARFSFRFPGEYWRTDTCPTLKVVRTVPVTDESDLHNFDNLVAFMLWRTTRAIENEFRKDPSLLTERSRRGANVAMAAAANGGPEVVDFLIRHGVDWRAKAELGENLLYCALQSENPEMIERALKLGFDVNAPFVPSSFTPLIAASLYGKDVAVRTLLAHGADPNRVDSQFFTPLCVVVQSPFATRYQVFEDLVKAKANVHYHTRDGLGLLDRAVADPKMVQRLLALGVSVDDRNPVTGSTPLMTAADRGCFPAAKLLLSRGADLHAVDKKGRSVFDYARMSNTLKTDEFFRRGVGLPPSKE